MFAKDDLIEYIESHIDSKDIPFERLKYEPLLQRFAREEFYRGQDDAYQGGYDDARREYENSGYDDGYKDAEEDCKLGRLEGPLTI